MNLTDCMEIWPLRYDKVQLLPWKTELLLNTHNVTTSAQKVYLKSIKQALKQFLTKTSPEMDASNHTTLKLAN